MSRPVRVAIDTAALRHNFQRAREIAAGSRVMAVVKAQAYGHGLARAADAFGEADAFGVACLEEAVALREAGVFAPVVLLEGAFEPRELPEAAHGGFELVVHTPGQIRDLEAARLAQPLTVWLKVDTGMHRLGFAGEAVADAFDRLNRCPNVGQVRLMTHLGYADDRRDSRTGEQLARFAAVSASLEAERSAANSGGMLGWPDSRLEWVRPGLMLYGVSPYPGDAGPAHALEPAMTFKTRLIAVNHHRRGEAVGYGGAWVCPEDMPVGVAAVGYGDGYPRHVANGTPVLVNGQRTPLVGRVSMDMIQVDLRGQPQAQPGDEVVLWGRGLTVEEIAACAETIPYELLCAVTRRVPVDAHAADVGAGGGMHAKKVTSY